MVKRTALAASFILATLAVCAITANAQIAKITNTDGRQLFINDAPPKPLKVSAFSGAKPRATIYLPAVIATAWKGLCEKPRIATTWTPLWSAR